MRQHRVLTIATLLTGLAPSVPAQSLSTQALLDFVNTRYQAYFHYNICTFKNLASEQRFGRSTGKEPPSLWAPTGLDCEQWARVCRDSGMAGGWLTTKHHGGFCLWDSAVTDYDVASSPVKTDVVRVFTDTFRRAGLKIGLYYSILDYHHGVENGSVTRAEIDFLKAQITELLTRYGPIDYLNFDGWSTWPTTPNFDDVPYGEIYRTVKAAQPDCLIVNHCYESNHAHADIPFADAAGRRYPYHPDYLRPTAASDTSQVGWWWDDNPDYGVRRGVDYLLKQLHSYNSHNAVYVLNISPGPDGRLPDDAVARLAATARAWQRPAPLAAAESNWGFQYDVRDNLAFLRPCRQSSTAGFIRDKRAYPRAEIAVDGVTEGNGDMEQTSITESEVEAWWQVDLERDCRVTGITLHGRTDQPAEALPALRVRLLDATGATLWQRDCPTPPDPVLRLEARAAPVRRVWVQRRGTGRLCLAEVVVRGRPVR